MPIPMLSTFEFLPLAWNGLISAPVATGLILSYAVAALTAVTLILIYDGTEMRSKKERRERHVPAPTFGRAPTPSHA